MMIAGKRELAARALLWSGATELMRFLPARDSLLVLTYHRIGNAAGDIFDPEVFSATAEEFERQVAYLKRRLDVVTLDEALDFIDGSAKDAKKRCRALITFDDGYLDNYQFAFPILRSLGVQGVFFLPTDLVGSSYVPWWDQIAFLLRTARRKRFSLHYPDSLEVDLDRDGFTASLRTVQHLFGRPENHNEERFMQDLIKETQGDSLPPVARRFLNWDEAREMLAGGMAIGSHTQSHAILSQLSPEKQTEELIRSRAVLGDKLGITAEALAYPVGGRASFTEATQKIARKAGYRAAFSYYGGTNLPGSINAYDVQRNTVDTQSLRRFFVQASIYRLAAKFWP
jgi:peptidoglycan/xylan/chitin deacetylase (PgdA/CDA1 family)